MNKQEFNKKCTSQEKSSDDMPITNIQPDLNLPKSVKFRFCEGCENDILSEENTEKLVKKQKLDQLFSNPYSHKPPFFQNIPKLIKTVNDSKSISSETLSSEDENGKSGGIKREFQVKSLSGIHEKLAKLDFKLSDTKFYNTSKDSIKIKLPQQQTTQVLSKIYPDKEVVSANDDEFIHDLEIVSNKNEKEMIKVSFHPTKAFTIPTKLPNPFDKLSRDEFFKQNNFTLDYQNGYEPIAIQAQQENEFTYKDHFIRKKQSSAKSKLKRVCGVSYVKKSESQQLNVDNIFEKLPSLVFQGSTGYSILDSHEDFISKTFDKIFSNCRKEPLLVTLMEADDENLMRTYLSCPEQRYSLAEGKVWIVTDFEDIWHYFRDRVFVCIHLLYDSKEFLKKPHLSKIAKQDIIDALYESNVQLGLLCRKSTSGKRAFMNSFFDEVSSSGSSDEEEKKPATDSKSKSKNSIKKIKLKPTSENQIKKRSFKKILNVRKKLRFNQTPKKEAPKPFKSQLINNIINTDVEFRMTRNYIKKAAESNDKNDQKDEVKITKFEDKIPPQLISEKESKSNEVSKKQTHEITIDASKNNLSEVKSSNLPPNRTESKPLEDNSVNNENEVIITSYKPPKKNFISMSNRQAATKINQTNQNVQKNVQNFAPIAQQISNFPMQNSIFDNNTVEIIKNALFNKFMQEIQGIVPPNMKLVLVPNNSNQSNSTQPGNLAPDSKFSYQQPVLNSYPSPYHQQYPQQLPHLYSQQYQNQISQQNQQRYPNQQQYYQSFNPHSLNQLTQTTHSSIQPSQYPLAPQGPYQQYQQYQQPNLQNFNTMNQHDHIQLQNHQQQNLFQQQGGQQQLFANPFQSSNFGQYLLNQNQSMQSGQSLNHSNFQTVLPPNNLLSNQITQHIVQNNFGAHSQYLNQNFQNQTDASKQARTSTNQVSSAAMPGNNHEKSKKTIPSSTIHIEKDKIQEKKDEKNIQPAKKNPKILKNESEISIENKENEENDRDNKQDQKPNKEVKRNETNDSVYPSKEKKYEKKLRVKNEIQIIEEKSKSPLQKIEVKKKEVAPTRTLLNRASKATSRLVTKLITQSDSSDSDDFDVKIIKAEPLKIVATKPLEKSAKSVKGKFLDPSPKDVKSIDTKSEETRVTPISKDDKFSESHSDIEDTPKKSEGEEKLKSGLKVLAKELANPAIAKLSNKEKNLLKKHFEKEDKTTITTMSIRVEVYCNEKSWKSADKFTRELLHTFSEISNEKLAKRLQAWTKVRFDLTKKVNSKKLEEKSEGLFFFETPSYKYNMSKFQVAESVPANLNWKFSRNIKDITVKDKEKQDFSVARAKNYSFADLQEIDPDAKNMERELLPLTYPLYLITTRDSFAYDLVEKHEIIEFNGRKILKTEYFFDKSSVPDNFKVFKSKFPDLRVGVTTYNNFFTHEELKDIEEKCYDTERKFFSNHYLPMTGQMSCTNDKVKRTKFFFGARYIWSRQQLSDPHSMVGAGIRVDVSEPPKWMIEKVEQPLVDANIIPRDFINSYALNVYHDGNEGLAQHFDDAVRFRQPIFTLRIFSDSRLSFGSQFYGFCNGAFCIPMPRGCVTVLEEESYAANGIKHCVRPCDMTGKSSALILRQMHYKVYNEAKLYDEFVDFPTWFSTLSIDPDAVSYSDQKKMESEEFLKASKKKET